MREGGKGREEGVCCVGEKTMKGGGEEERGWRERNRRNRDRRISVHCKSYTLPPLF